MNFIRIKKFTVAKLGGFLGFSFTIIKHMTNGIVNKMAEIKFNSEIFSYRKNLKFYIFKIFILSSLQQSKERPNSQLQFQKY